MIHTIEAGRHKRLSASSASRWVPCPASADLQEDSVSEEAAQGTVAHEVAKRMFAGAHSEDIPKQMKADGFTIEVDDEMIEHCTEYVDYCLALSLAGHSELPVTDVLEKHVDKDTGGQADFVAYQTETQHLHVVDFKYGMMQVEAEDNPQLKLYALGVLLTLTDPAQKVTVHIYQPRGMGVAAREFTFHPADLLEFRADIRAAAELTRSKSPPFKAGTWCRFCSHAPKCDELKSQSVALVKATGTELEDINKLAELAKQIPMMEIMIKTVKERISKLMKAGTKVPGHKWVKGKQYRKWTDEKAARAFLESSGAEDLVKLITPAQAEKKLDKDGKKALQSMIRKMPAGTVVALETDKRAEVKQAAASDFDLT